MLRNGIREVAKSLAIRESGNLGKSEPSLDIGRKAVWDDTKAFEECIV